jgi:hypothetical protein
VIDRTDPLIGLSWDMITVPEVRLPEKLSIRIDAWARTLPPLSVEILRSGESSAGRAPVVDKRS